MTKAINSTRLDPCFPLSPRAAKSLVPPWDAQLSSVICSPAHTAGLILSQLAENKRPPYCQPVTKCKFLIAPKISSFHFDQSRFANHNSPPGRVECLDSNCNRAVPQTREENA